MRKDDSLTEELQPELRKLHLSPQATLNIHSKYQYKRSSSNSPTSSPPKYLKFANKKAELKISDFGLLSKIGEGTYCEVFQAV